MSESLTIDLHNRLHYEPETGLFTWKQHFGRVKKGAAAGALKPHGYVYIQVNKKNYGAHRLAWIYVNGEMPKGEIDHINGIRNDNRIANLRDVPAAMNQQNQRSPQSDNKTSDFLGVSWHSRSCKWRASITINGTTKEIGKFKTQEEAYFAYVTKKREVHPGCVL
jgi:hypothetical protein